MNNPFETNPYQTPSSESSAMSGMPNRTYGGIRRLPYFGFTFLAAIIYQVVVVGIVAALGGGGNGNGNGGIVLGVTIVALLAYLGVLFYIAGQRLINIGSSPWWCLGLMVPLLNIFVGIRCLICPEGYSDHKTLDTPAKVILGLAIAMIVLAVASLFIGLAAQ